MSVNAYLENDPELRTLELTTYELDIRWDTGERETVVVCEQPCAGTDLDDQVFMDSLPIEEAKRAMGLPSDSDRALGDFTVTSLDPTPIKCKARITDMAEYIEHGEPSAPVPVALMERSAREALDEIGLSMGKISEGMYEIYETMPFTGSRVSATLSMREGDPQLEATWRIAANELESSISPSAVTYEPGDIRPATQKEILDETGLFTQCVKGGLESAVVEGCRAALWSELDYWDVGCVRAAWAFELEDGTQAIADVHIVTDDDSPWGYSFFAGGYTFDDEAKSWEPFDAVQFWRYTDARAHDLKCEAICLCGTAMPDLAEVHEIDADLLEEVGVGEYSPSSGRRLTADELFSKEPPCSAEALENTTISALDPMDKDTRRTSELSR